MPAVSQGTAGDLGKSFRAWGRASQASTLKLVPPVPSPAESPKRFSTSSFLKLATVPVSALGWTYRCPRGDHNEQASMGRRRVRGDGSGVGAVGAAGDGREPGRGEI